MNPDWEDWLLIVVVIVWGIVVCGILYWAKKESRKDKP